MALQTINLDDRTFDQLVDIARKHIPVSDWTDHNPSDPGMMLLEMLCWIGEMTLYRMNRVPDAHQQKFLNLLIDPPQPVTVDVTFSIVFDAGSLPLANPIVIDAGTQLATDFVDGRRLVFETLTPATFHDPVNAGDAVTQTVVARELLAVTNQVLGVSNGKPDQTFQLSPPNSLKASPGQPLPVLLDFVNPAPPKGSRNPRVSVGGVAWEIRQFLLAEGSRVTGANPALHFMVEAFENRVRFGNGVFGAIPPAGQAIQAERYQVLQGPSALIKANSLRYVLDDIAGLKPADDLTITHDDGLGGLNIFSPATRFAEGLRTFRAPLRVITEADFERALLEDFNDFQSLSGSLPRLARAVAMMNRKPPLQTVADAPGHVTILVLPEFDESVLRNPAVALANKEALLALAPDVETKILRFLDDRRLITTRLHLASPSLMPLDVTANVVALNDRDTARMDAGIRARLAGFLGILRGDFDGRGWRLGRDVYRSQIFRVLEEIDGVDYVKSLSLSPANAQGDVTIGPQQLPLLQNLFLTIERS